MRHSIKSFPKQIRLGQELENFSFSQGLAKDEHLDFMISDLQSDIRNLEKRTNVQKHQGTKQKTGQSQPTNVYANLKVQIPGQKNENQKEKDIGKIKYMDLIKLDQSIKGVQQTKQQSSGYKGWHETRSKSQLLQRKVIAPQYSQPTTSSAGKLQKVSHLMLNEYPGQPSKVARSNTTGLLSTGAASAYNSQPNQESYHKSYFNTFNLYQGKKKIKDQASVTQQIQKGRNNYNSNDQEQSYSGANNQQSDQQRVQPLDSQLVCVDTKTGDIFVVPKEQLSPQAKSLGHTLPSPYAGNNSSLDALLKIAYPDQTEDQNLNDNTDQQQNISDMYKAKYLDERLLTWIEHCQSRFIGQCSEKDQDNSDNNDKQIQRKIKLIRSDTVNVAQNQYNGNQSAVGSRKRSLFKVMKGIRTMSYNERDIQKYNQRPRPENLQSQKSSQLSVNQQFNQSGLRNDYSEELFQLKHLDKRLNRVSDRDSSNQLSDQSEYHVNVSIKPEVSVQRPSNSHISVSFTMHKTANSVYKQVKNKRPACHSAHQVKDFNGAPRWPDVVANYRLPAQGDGKHKVCEDGCYNSADGQGSQQSTRPRKKHRPPQVDVTSNIDQQNQNLLNWQTQNSISSSQQLSRYQTNIPTLQNTLSQLQQYISVQQLQLDELAYGGRGKNPQSSASRQLLLHSTSTTNTSKVHKAKFQQNIQQNTYQHGHSGCPYCDTCTSNTQRNDAASIESLQKAIHTNVSVPGSLASPNAHRSSQNIRISQINRQDIQLVDKKVESMRSTLTRAHTTDLNSNPIKKYSTLSNQFYQKQLSQNNFLVLDKGENGSPPLPAASDVSSASSIETDGSQQPAMKTFFSLHTLSPTSSKQKSPESTAQPVKNQPRAWKPSGQVANAGAAQSPARRPKQPRQDINPNTKAKSIFERLSSVNPIQDPQIIQTTKSTQPRSAVRRKWIPAGVKDSKDPSPKSPRRQWGKVVEPLQQSGRIKTSEFKQDKSTGLVKPGKRTTAWDALNKERKSDNITNREGEASSNSSTYSLVDRAKDVKGHMITSADVYEQFAALGQQYDQQYYQKPSSLRSPNAGVQNPNAEQLPSQSNFSRLSLDKQLDSVKQQQKIIDEFSLRLDQYTVQTSPKRSPQNSSNQHHSKQSVTKDRKRGTMSIYDKHSISRESQKSSQYREMQPHAGAAGLKVDEEQLAQVTAAIEQIATARRPSSRKLSAMSIINTVTAMIQPNKRSSNLSTQFEQGSFSQHIGSQKQTKHKEYLRTKSTPQSAMNPLSHYKQLKLYQEDDLQVVRASKSGTDARDGRSDLATGGHRGPLGVFQTKSNLPRYMQSHTASSVAKTRRQRQYNTDFEENIFTVPEHFKQQLRTISPTNWSRSQSSVQSPRATPRTSPYQSPSNSQHGMAKLGSQTQARGARQREFRKYSLQPKHNNGNQGVFRPASNSVPSNVFDGSNVERFASLLRSTNTTARAQQTSPKNSKPGVSYREQYVKKIDKASKNDIYINGKDRQDQGHGINSKGDQAEINDTSDGYNASDQNDSNYEIQPVGFNFSDPPSQQKETQRGKSLEQTTLTSRGASCSYEAVDAIDVSLSQYVGKNLSQDADQIQSRHVSSRNQIPSSLYAGQVQQQSQQPQQNIQQDIYDQQDQQIHCMQDQTSNQRQLENKDRLNRLKLEQVRRGNSELSSDIVRKSNQQVIDDVDETNQIIANFLTQQISKQNQTRLFDRNSRRSGLQKSNFTQDGEYPQLDQQQGVSSIANSKASIRQDKTQSRALFDYSTQMQIDQLYQSVNNEVCGVQSRSQLAKSQQSEQLNSSKQYPKEHYQYSNETRDRNIQLNSTQMVEIKSHSEKSQHGPRSDHGELQQKLDQPQDQIELNNTKLQNKSGQNLEYSQPDDLDNGSIENSLNLSQNDNPENCDSKHKPTATCRSMDSGPSDYEAAKEQSSTNFQVVQQTTALQDVNDSALQQQNLNTVTIKLQDNDSNEPYNVANGKSSNSPTYKSKAVLSGQGKSSQTSNLQQKGNSQDNLNMLNVSQNQNSDLLTQDSSSMSVTDKQRAESPNTPRSNNVQSKIRKLIYRIESKVKRRNSGKKYDARNSSQSTVDGTDSQYSQSTNGQSKSTEAGSTSKDNLGKSTPQFNQQFQISDISDKNTLSTNIMSFKNVHQHQKQLQLNGLLQADPNHSSTNDVGTLAPNIGINSSIQNLNKFLNSQPHQNEQIEEHQQESQIKDILGSMDQNSAKGYQQRSYVTQSSTTDLHEANKSINYSSNQSSDRLDTRNTTPFGSSVRESYASSAVGMSVASRATPNESYQAKIENQQPRYSKSSDITSQSSDPSPSQRRLFSGSQDRVSTSSQTYQLASGIKEAELKREISQTQVPLQSKATNISLNIQNSDLLQVADTHQREVQIGQLLGNHQRISQQSQRYENEHNNDKFNSQKLQMQPNVQQWAYHNARAVENVARASSGQSSKLSIDSAGDKEGSVMTLIEPELKQYRQSDSFKIKFDVENQYEKQQPHGEQNDLYQQKDTQKPGHRQLHHFKEQHQADGYKYQEPGFKQQQSALQSQWESISPQRTTQRNPQQACIEKQDPNIYSMEQSSVSDLADPLDKQGGININNQVQQVPLLQIDQDPIAQQPSQTTRLLSKQMTIQRDNIGPRTLYNSSPFPVKDVQGNNGPQIATNRSLVRGGAGSNSVGRVASARTNLLDPNAMLKQYEPVDNQQQTLAQGFKKQFSSNLAQNIDSLARSQSGSSYSPLLEGQQQTQKPASRQLSRQDSASLQTYGYQGLNQQQNQVQALNQYHSAYQSTSEVDQLSSPPAMNFQSQANIYTEKQKQEQIAQYQNGNYYDNQELPFQYNSNSHLPTSKTAFNLYPDHAQSSIQQMTDHTHEQKYFIQNQFINENSDVNGFDEQNQHDQYSKHRSQQQEDWQLSQSKESKWTKLQHNVRDQRYNLQKSVQGGQLENRNQFEQASQPIEMEQRGHILNIAQQGLQIVDQQDNQLNIEQSEYYMNQQNQKDLHGLSLDHQATSEIPWTSLQQQHDQQHNFASNQKYMDDLQQQIGQQRGLQRQLSSINGPNHQLQQTPQPQTSHFGYNSQPNQETRNYEQDNKNGSFQQNQSQSLIIQHVNTDNSSLPNTYQQLAQTSALSKRTQQVGNQTQQAQLYDYYNSQYGEQPQGDFNSPGAQQLQLQQQVQHQSQQQVQHQFGQIQSQQSQPYDQQQQQRQQFDEQQKSYHQSLYVQHQQQNLDQIQSPYQYQQHGDLNYQQQQQYDQQQQYQQTMAGPQAEHQTTNSFDGMEPVSAEYIEQQNKILMRQQSQQSNQYNAAHHLTTYPEATPYTASNQHHQLQMPQLNNNTTNQLFQVEQNQSQQQSLSDFEEGQPEVERSRSNLEQQVVHPRSMLNQAQLEFQSVSQQPQPAQPQVGVNLQQQQFSLQQQQDQHRSPPSQQQQYSDPKLSNVNQQPRDLTRQQSPLNRLKELRQKSFKQDSQQNGVIQQTNNDYQKSARQPVSTHKQNAPFVGQQLTEDNTLQGHIQMNNNLNGQRNTSQQSGISQDLTVQRQLHRKHSNISQAQVDSGNPRQFPPGIIDQEQGEIIQQQSYIDSAQNQSVHQNQLQLAQSARTQQGSQFHAMIGHNTEQKYTNKAPEHQQQQQYQQQYNNTEQASGLPSPKLQPNRELGQQNISRTESMKQDISGQKDQNIINNQIEVYNQNGSVIQNAYNQQLVIQERSATGAGNNTSELIQYSQTSQQTIFEQQTVTEQKIIEQTIMQSQQMQHVEGGVIEQQINRIQQASNMQSLAHAQIATDANNSQYVSQSKVNQQFTITDQSEEQNAKSNNDAQQLQGSNQSIIELPLANNQPINIHDQKLQVSSSQGNKPTLTKEPSEIPYEQDKYQQLVQAVQQQKEVQELNQRTNENQQYNYTEQDDQHSDNVDSHHDELSIDQSYIENQEQQRQFQPSLSSQFTPSESVSPQTSHIQSPEYSPDAFRHNELFDDSTQKSRSTLKPQQVQSSNSLRQEPAAQGQTGQQKSTTLLAQKDAIYPESPNQDGPGRDGGDFHVSNAQQVTVDNGMVSVQQQVVTVSAVVEQADVTQSATIQQVVAPMLHEQQQGQATIESGAHEHGDQEVGNAVTASTPATVGSPGEQAPRDAQRVGINQDQLQDSQSQLNQLSDSIQQEVQQVPATSENNSEAKPILQPSQQGRVELQVETEQVSQSPSSKRTSGTTAIPNMQQDAMGEQQTELQQSPPPSKSSSRSAMPPRNSDRAVTPARPVRKLQGSQSARLPRTESTSSEQEVTKAPRKPPVPKFSRSASARKPVGSTATALDRSASTNAGQSTNALKTASKARALTKSYSSAHSALKASRGDEKNSGLAKTSSQRKAANDQKVRAEEKVGLKQEASSTKALVIAQNKGSSDVSNNVSNDVSQTLVKNTYIVKEQITQQSQEVVETTTTTTTNIINQSMQANTTSQGQSQSLTSPLLDATQIAMQRLQRREQARAQLGLNQGILQQSDQSSGNQIKNQNKSEKPQIQGPIVTEVISEIPGTNDSTLGGGHIANDIAMDKQSEQSKNDQNSEKIDVQAAAIGQPHNADDQNAALLNDYVRRSSRRSARLSRSSRLVNVHSAREREGSEVSSTQDLDKRDSHGKYRLSIKDGDGVYEKLTFENLQKSAKQVEYNKHEVLQISQFRSEQIQESGSTGIRQRRRQGSSQLVDIDPDSPSAALGILRESDDEGNNTGDMQNIFRESMRRGARLDRGHLKLDGDEPADGKTGKHKKTKHKDKDKEKDKSKVKDKDKDKDKHKSKSKSDKEKSNKEKSKKDKKQRFVVDAEEDTEIVHKRKVTSRTTIRSLAQVDVFDNIPGQQTPKPAKEISVKQQYQNFEQIQAARKQRADLGNSANEPVNDIANDSKQGSTNQDQKEEQNSRGLASIRKYLSKR